MFTIKSRASLRYPQKTACLLVTFPKLQQHRINVFYFPLNVTSSNSPVHISGFHFSERDANPAKHRTSVVRSVTWPCCCSRYLLGVQVRAPTAEPVTGKSISVTMLVFMTVTMLDSEGANKLIWTNFNGFLGICDKFFVSTIVSGRKYS